MHARMMDLQYVLVTKKENKTNHAAIPNRGSVLNHDRSVRLWLLGVNGGRCLCRVGLCLCDRVGLGHWGSVGHGMLLLLMHYYFELAGIELGKQKKQ